MSRKPQQAQAAAVIRRYTLRVWLHFFFFSTSLRGLTAYDCGADETSLQGI